MRCTWVMCLFFSLARSRETIAAKGDKRHSPQQHNPSLKSHTRATRLIAGKARTSKTREHKMRYHSAPQIQINWRSFFSNQDFMQISTSNPTKKTDIVTVVEVSEGAHANMEPELQALERIAVVGSSSLVSSSSSSLPPTPPPRQPLCSLSLSSSQTLGHSRIARAYVPHALPSAHCSAHLPSFLLFAPCLITWLACSFHGSSCCAQAMWRVSELLSQHVFSGFSTTGTKLE